MKLRVKFEKKDKMVYVGHLDFLRYFQKAIRRSEIDVKYSEGFSPHQLISFAHPLGIGTETVGDYFDLEVNSLPKGSIVDILNKEMTEGVKVTKAVVLPDKTINAMAFVAAADYEISLKEGQIPEKVLDILKALQKSEELNIIKTGKNGDREVNIRPFIYGLDFNENMIKIRLDASSANNVKPFIFMEKIFNMAGIGLEQWMLKICRMETYGLVEGLFRPLDYCGREI